MDGAEIDQLLAEYADAAVAHRTASRDGTPEVANGCYKRIRVVVRRIGEEPSAREAFLRLLDDERVEVRGWAATHALEFAPDRAAATLDAIAAGPTSLEEFSAQMVLREYRAGKRVG